MSYTKPNLGLLGASIKAIQGQQGVDPINKTSTLYQDAPPFSDSHLAATVNAYEADE